MDDTKSARLAYARIKILYAGVQHKLTEEKRRDFRVRIVQLASMMRRDEEVTVRLASATKIAPLIAEDLIRSG